MIADRTCATCAWHDSFSWVCFNGDSPYCADFTQNEQKCRFWELQKPQQAEAAESASVLREICRKTAERAQKAPLTADG